MEGKVGNQATLFHGVFQLLEVRRIFVYVDRKNYSQAKAVTAVTNGVLAVFIESDNFYYMVLRQRDFSSLRRENCCNIQVVII